MSIQISLKNYSSFIISTIKFDFRHYKSSYKFINDFHSDLIFMPDYDGIDLIVGDTYDLVITAIVSVKKSLDDEYELRTLRAEFILHLDIDATPIFSCQKLNIT